MARRWRSGWCAPPRSAGSPAGLTSRRPRGTGRSWPAWACRCAIRAAPGRSCGTRWLSTRRPAAGTCAWSCWTGWPGRAYSLTRPRTCSPAPIRRSDMPAVLVLNGPNLARLGSREPDVYGTATLDDLRTACEATASKLGLSVDFRQTDDESQLIAWVHEAADRRLPMVLNPAAFTQHPHALRDALAQRTAPLVEGHL